MHISAIPRQKTAIKRHRCSRPVNTAINDGLIDPSKIFFDYGCGRGDDIKNLKKIGIQCTGWDPKFRPSTPRQPADIVNLGYVINVIEDQAERAETLKTAWKLAKDLLIVSAQLFIDAKTTNYSPYKDGYLTKIGTFQKYFEQQELRQWIVSTLGEGAVPAAPGIFYVFRDPEAKEAFISSRYRRKAATPRLRKIRRAL
jgi:DNA phosphorothioation-associated putative methyltransferase